MKQLKESDLMVIASMENLYQSDHFKLLRFSDKEAWRDNRFGHIGGSDAAVFVGANKYKSLRDWVYEHKNHIKSDLSDNPYVQYGVQAEPILRDLYRLKHPDQDIQYIPDCTLESVDHPILCYSPDGLINDPEKGKGVWECKTYNFRNRDKYDSDWGSDWDQDQMKIPDAYYCQVLHGLIVTGYDFATVFAEIRYGDSYSKLIERTIYRKDVQEDMKILLESELEKFERYYIQGESCPIEIDL